MESAPRRRDNTLPVMLELLPGLLLWTYGIGHIVQGRVTKGVALMLGYWAAIGVNVLLTFVWVGFVTGPLTFVVMALYAPLSAAGYPRR